MYFWQELVSKIVDFWKNFDFWQLISKICWKKSNYKNRPIRATHSASAIWLVDPEFNGSDSISSILDCIWAAKVFCSSVAFGSSLINAISDLIESTVSCIVWHFLVIVFVKLKKIEINFHMDNAFRILASKYLFYFLPNYIFYNKFGIEVNFENGPYWGLFSMQNFLTGNFLTQLVRFFNIKYVTLFIVFFSTRIFWHIFNRKFFNTKFFFVFDFWEIVFVL